MYYDWWVSFLLHLETSGIKLPETWEPMKGEIFKRVVVAPGSDEYQKVMNSFVNMTSVQKACCSCC